MNKKIKEERKHILLVEDDVGHAKLVHRAFEGYHDRFRLTTAANLKEALAHLEKSSPHLVITDLILPDGKGIDLLSSASKGKGRGSAFPLVVMTGYGDEQMAVDILKAGALDYVVKLESSLRDMPRTADRALRQWEAIVERRRAEKALAESEEKFRALIEKASDLIIILDKDAVYRYLSPSVVDITGIAPGEMIGKTPAHFLHPGDKTKVYDILDQVMETPGTTLTIPNFRVQAKRGEHHWVNLEGRVTNMLDVSGVKGIVINCRDVTELKQMEEVLDRMEKLESIGLLAGGIAHDYNNILTIILGNLAVARLANSKGKLLRSLSEAEKGVLKARDLTQQLLTFAKGGAPVKETASIEEIVKDSAGFSLRGSNVSLELDFQEGLHAVDVDKGQISQVIHNLLLNADQAMPDGGVISIRGSNTEIDKGNIYGLPAGKYIKMAVSDQGIGISYQYKGQVFDPYFTTKNKGSGLGLSIVYSIIHRHNGFVDFDSQPGKGTTFYIYLPASEGKIAEIQPMEELVRGEGKVLVVDDEECIREVGTLLLESLGYIVSTAQSGEEAVEICKKEGFDAVIMDLTIPRGMGGKEAAREIRKFDKKVKLVVSSGYSHDPVMSMYEKFGFDGVLVKPYKLEQIGLVIRNLLGLGSKA